VRFWVRIGSQHPTGGFVRFWVRIQARRNAHATTFSADPKKKNKQKKQQQQKTRCVFNATNAPALSQSFKDMFNLFQFQGG
jgi:hypothetical protein